MKKPHALALVGLLLAITAVTTAADTLYTIQRGDTLAAIARRFNSSVQTLSQRNNIANPNLIYSGQRIVIPDNSSNPPAPANPTPSNQSRYTVQSGDTLAAIARRFGTTVLALVQANNLSNPNLIFVGRELTIPGSTPRPANEPAPTNEPLPTDDPLPPASPTGGNLLPNGSFEGGWHHPNGIPELQIPDQWRLEWDEGQTEFGSEDWDVYVRPEVRVLPSQFLPPHEHGLFIWDGNQTVKIFKGRGPVSFRLLTNVSLPVGTYRLTINLFPDLVRSVENGSKVWADNGAGDMQFIINGQRGAWRGTAVGQRNQLTHDFTISQNQTISLGVGIRGKYAILNNGWFMDNWQLHKLQ